MLLLLIFWSLLLLKNLNTVLLLLLLTRLLTIAVVAVGTCNFFVAKFAKTIDFFLFGQSEGIYIVERGVKYGTHSIFDTFVKLDRSDGVDEKGDELVHVSFVGSGGKEDESDVEIGNSFIESAANGMKFSNSIFDSLLILVEKFLKARGELSEA